jgi:hypothetical protein
LWITSENVALAVALITRWLDAYEGVSVWITAESGKAMQVQSGEEVSLRLLQLLISSRQKPETTGPLGGGIARGSSGVQAGQGPWTKSADTDWTIIEQDSAARVGDIRAMRCIARNIGDRPSSEFRQDTSSTGFSLRACASAGATVPPRRSALRPTQHRHIGRR